MKLAKNKLLKLFDKLQHWILEYEDAYRNYKLCLRKQESFTHETAKDAKSRMEYALTEIKYLREKISKCFTKEGYVELLETLTKEAVEEISDRYQELFNEVTYIKMEMTLPGVQKFPELMEMHSQVTKQFEILNNNIKFYNNQPEVVEFGFKIISPEEAAELYGERYSILQQKLKENNRLNGRTFVR